MNNSFSLLLSRLAVLGLLLTIALGCSKSENTVADPKTITDQILEDKQFSLLKAAMNYSGVGDALKGANLTFFAPNDSAFYRSGITSEAAITAMPKDQVKNILLYHTLYAPVSLSAIPSGVNAVQTASQSIAYLNNMGGGTVYINNAKIIQPDIKAANGIIHIIDHVLSPSTGSLLTTIQNTDNLTFLSAALKRIASSNPSLITSLNNTAATNPLTVFAPNDNAFMVSGYRTISAIETASPQTLSSLLSYHMVSGLSLRSNLKTGSVTTLLANNKINITVSNDVVTIKGNKNTLAATIRTADIIANNGVIHIIDQVLQP